MLQALQEVDPDAAVRIRAIIAEEEVVPYTVIHELGKGSSHSVSTHNGPYPAADKPPTTPSEWSSDSSDHTLPLVSDGATRWARTRIPPSSCKCPHAFEHTKDEVDGPFYCKRWCVPGTDRCPLCPSGQTSCTCFCINCPNFDRWDKTAREEYGWTSIAVKREYHPS